MTELRWNPLTRDWVMIASHRQGRPQMPKDWCPFCPGSGKVPEQYEVLKYDNDFPALSLNPEIPSIEGDDFYQVREAYGKCEVILYSPDHTRQLSELSLTHVRKIVDLWTERYIDLGRDENIKYIFVFENRGKMVGVTMPHPHGQIYAYSYIPKRMQEEINHAKNYYIESGECIYCKMLEKERQSSRVVFENDSFSAFVPFFSEYPYGVYIMAKEHIGSLKDMGEKCKDDLADALIKMTKTYDALFNMEFPYLMCVYQEPVGGSYKEVSHFHIKFFPPLRSEHQQKFNASSETGAWAHCNTATPEEKAYELRQSYINNVKEKEADCELP